MRRYSALERREPLEHRVALVDLRPRQREQPVQAEGLDAERRQRAAHDHGPAQRRVALVLGALGQVADEAAREGVAGAGRDRTRSRAGRPGAAKEPSSANISTPCSPFLTTSVRGPMRADRARGLHEVPLARELARLRVVDQQHVDARERLAQLLAACRRSRSSSCRRPRRAGCSTCSSTSSCSTGSMLPRNTSSERR